MGELWTRLKGVSAGLGGGYAVKDVQKICRSVVQPPSFGQRGVPGIRYSTRLLLSPLNAAL